MLDFKAFKLSNIVTIIGIYIALILTIPVQIRQFAAGNSKIFYFRDYISAYEHTLNEEEIEAWLEGLRTIRQSDHVIHLELQDETEMNLIPDESFASIEEEFWKSEIEYVSEYMQENLMFCYVEGSVALTEEQRQLDRVCRDFGMTLEMSDPAGKKQSDTAKAREKFYKIMFVIAGVCSLIVLSVVEFFWFQCRKKAWYVRQLFCIPRISLIKEIVLVQGLLLFIALAAALVSMLLLFHFSIFQIMKSAVTVLTMFLFLLLFFCFFVPDV